MKNVLLITIATTLFAGAIAHADDKTADLDRSCRAMTDKTYEELLKPLYARFIDVTGSLHKKISTPDITAEQTVKEVLDFDKKYNQEISKVDYQMLVSEDGIPFIIDKKQISTQELALFDSFEENTKNCKNADDTLDYLNTEAHNKLERLVYEIAAIYLKAKSEVSIAQAKKATEASQKLIQLITRRLDVLNYNKDMMELRRSFQTDISLTEDSAANENQQEAVSNQAAEK